MYKDGSHLACGDVGISPYRRLSGELDVRGSVRVRVGGRGVLRRPDVFLCRVVGGIVSLVVSCHWWCLPGPGYIGYGAAHPCSLRLQMQQVETPLFKSLQYAFDPLHGSGELLTLLQLFATTPPVEHVAHELTHPCFSPPPCPDPQPSEQ